MTGTSWGQAWEWSGSHNCYSVMSGRGHTHVPTSSLSEWVDGQWSSSCSSIVCHNDMAGRKGGREKGREGEQRADLGVSHGFTPSLLLHAVIFLSPSATCWALQCQVLLLTSHSGVSGGDES